MNTSPFTRHVRVASRALGAVCVCAVGLALLARPAAAQGTLAGQGFGYPPGQVSARSAAAGSSLADFDPFSATNPAALAAFVPSGVYFQYSPEFRHVDAGDASGSSSVVRFPLVAGATPIGTHGVIGLALSTFLDRTWGTEVSGSELVGGDQVDFDESLTSKGAISDIRLGAAWSIGPNVSVGVGGHLLTGENRVRSQRVFSTPGFSTLTQEQRVSYSGTALSGGALVRISRLLAVALTGRLGGSLSAFRNDSTVGRADVPDSYGGSVEYIGWSVATIAVRATHTQWSSMQSLTTSNLEAFDSWDYGVGTEVQGPTVLGQRLPLRLGVRYRTLPFGAGRANLTDPVASVRVRETTVGGGTSLSLAGGRGTLDLTLERASRSADIDAREHAWIFGMGIALRP
ncbi:MAG TPA: hypothetical protein VFK13_00595 [Gemmatimonadaceae bacterium]|nr:hypothetical protein [Gemmatimonadaceae bacterium]